MAERTDDKLQKAYEALLKYISPCLRSEQECRDKLYSKGFHRDEVEGAIEKAKSYRYINDEEYVRTFIYFNKNRMGSKKLEYRLTMEKGVDKALVQRLLDELIDRTFEVELCCGMAIKYCQQKHITGKSGQQKVSAFLYQKGFDWSVINTVLEALFDTY